MCTSGKSPLCLALEITDHMIQFPDPSYIQWRCKTVKDLRQTMNKTKTNRNLSKTFLIALTSWMDTGFIVIHNFPDNHKIINTQNKNV